VPTLRMQGSGCCLHPHLRAHAHPVHEATYAHMGTPCARAGWCGRRGAHVRREGRAAGAGQGQVRRQASPFVQLHWAACWHLCSEGLSLGGKWCPYVRTVLQVLTHLHTHRHAQARADTNGQTHTPSPQGECLGSAARDGCVEAAHSVCAQAGAALPVSILDPHGGGCVTQC